MHAQEQINHVDFDIFDSFFLFRCDQQRLHRHRRRRLISFRFNN